MMSMDEFIKNYDGKHIDYDGVYPNQCMDLFHYYELLVLEQPANELLRAGTAYQAYLKGHPEFDKYDYKPGNVPEYGDVMFWNTSVGTAGHVAIFVDGNSKTFTSFDQNWPVDSACHKQGHDYKGVAGWLRFKQFNEVNMKIEDIQRMIAEGDAATLAKANKYTDKKVEHRLSKKQAKQTYKPKGKKK